jgi:hypothetical protein
MTEHVNCGNVIRWFSVDWEFFGNIRAALDRHDEILKSLGSMRSAVEVNSGHTGVNVAFENTRRTNDQIIQNIKRRLSVVQKACKKQKGTE